MLLLERLRPGTFVAARLLRAGPRGGPAASRAGVVLCRWWWWWSEFVRARELRCSGSGKRRNEGGTLWIAKRWRRMLSGLGRRIEGGRRGLHNAVGTFEASLHLQVERKSTERET